MSIGLNKVTLRTIPGVGASVTVLTTQTGGSFIDLSASEGAYVAFQARGADVFIRGVATTSASIASASTDLFIEDGQIQEFQVTSGKKFLSFVKAAGDPTTTLRRADTSSE